MAVPHAHLLLAVRRAYARIHTEHDASRRSAAVHKVDPLRLETAHLARRSRSTKSRFAADNPTHRRIVAQALGVVHVLISSKAAASFDSPVGCAMTASLESSMLTPIYASLRALGKSVRDPVVS